MTTKKKFDGPPGLADAGQLLWGRLVDLFDFDEHELAMLEVACHQADDVAALEAIVATDGYMAPGSQGQPRLSMVVSEVRQGRLALGKLLGALSLPDEMDRPMTAASRSAKHAADVRWSRLRHQRERLADGPS